MQPQLWLLAYALGLAGAGVASLGWYFIETGEARDSLALCRRGEHCIVSGSLACLAFLLAGVFVQTIMLSGGIGS